MSSIQFSRAWFLSSLAGGLLLAVGCGGGPPPPGGGDLPGADRQLERQLRAVVARAGGEEGLDHFVLPSSDAYGRIPHDPENPITSEKVELGRLLFHDPALHTEPKLAMGRGDISCATCHHASAGFQDGAAQAVGEGAVGFGTSGEGRRIDPEYRTSPDSVDAQPVRSPTILNTAFQENLNWNGALGAYGKNEGTKYSWGGPAAFNRLGFRGMESQARAAMSVHGLSVDGLFEEVPEYAPLFEAAFPDFPEYDRRSDRAAALAMAAYERTVLANRAPFQRWLHGEEGAMTVRQKRGALLFFGKANCVECHTGPSLGTTRFEALGMKDLVQTGRALLVSDTLLVQDSAASLGRGGFTLRPEERYAFKVPQLYNLADMSFYGHGSSFTDLRSVVEYKNEARKENPRVPDERLSKWFVPLGLTDVEIADLVAFLRDALHDPDLERYAPERVLSGRCFPNDDPVSRRDLGCSGSQVARR